MVKVHVPLLTRKVTLVTNPAVNHNCSILGNDIPLHVSIYWRETEYLVSPPFSEIVFICCGFIFVVWLLSFNFVSRVSFFSEYIFRLDGYRVRTEVQLIWTMQSLPNTNKIVSLIHSTATLSQYIFMWSSVSVACGKSVIFVFVFPRIRWLLPAITYWRLR